MNCGLSGKIPTANGLKRPRFHRAWDSLDPGACQRDWTHRGHGQPLPGQAGRGESIINRRLSVPASQVAEAVELAREGGTSVRRKPTDLYDNTFAEELEKSGFLKEIWGGRVP